MKIIITGITGQDGSLMADYLLKNTDAIIYGVVRQLSVPNHNNIQHLKGNSRVVLVDGDITCPHSMSGIVKNIQPDYFINFAANSFVGTSWTNPTQVFETNTMSVLHQLEAIRKECPKCRYYQAGSSEEFGDIVCCPQDESHPLRPRSPYGASKASARHLVKVYRETYGLYAVAGWLYNHEGTRRGEQFVTRKISKGVARIYKAIKLFEKGIRGISPKELYFDPILLGNLNAKRDWSDAEDFVDGVWRMLNQEKHNNDLCYDVGNAPNKWLFLVKNIKDYVLASGESHTIAEFVEEAFKAAKINIDFISPSGYYYQLPYNKTIPLAVVDKNFYRPNEVDVLQGDSYLARKELSWTPKTSFRELVKKMVEHDLGLT